MTTYLLSLATLNEAAPGVLDMIFGKDGDFDGAPPWSGPAWWTRGNCFVHVGGRAYNDAFYCSRVDGTGQPVAEMADLVLDFRIPSVTARLAGLCKRVPTRKRPALALNLDSDWAIGAGLDSIAGREMHPDEAAALAALTLTLAPRIAALGGAR